MRRNALALTLFLLLAGTLASAQITAFGIYTKVQLRPPIFWTVSSGITSPAETASCDYSVCLAEVDMFMLTGFTGIVCPLPAGGTCLFYISVESGSVLSDPTSEGFYHILVDGSPVSPGPATSEPGGYPGYIPWGCVGNIMPSQGTGEGCLVNTSTRGDSLYAYSRVSVLARVTNRSFNQPHTFQIFDVCESNTDSGCKIEYWRGLAKFEVYE